ncbi:HAD family hydrolase [Metabacillus litoralis]|uniref:HAD family hydrolase n=1 Tax=Metabacillus litoralis TaxID=152268 RepID=A0A5C6WC47_9BACI|nr:HAD family hydrolase [Metabacillus litoralis]TXC93449.1 HAD family hydrolase [Metabacillus litoralis]
MLFDLDDTLLNRDSAVNEIFFIILKKCYGNVVDDTIKKQMLQSFKGYDKAAYGCNDKTKAFESLFDEFPPKYRLPSHEIQDFWNNHFPYCFSIHENTISLVNSIKKYVKVAIITNGSTERQKAKIVNTGLNNYFDIIIISEEVGLSKPDKRIFELALSELNVKSEDAFFVGDDLEKDISGCQNGNVRGIWYNPHNKKNETDIKPYAEISSLDEILRYIT